MTTKTLFLLCQQVNNWFEDAKEIGTFEVSGGQINTRLEGYKYIRIIGSNENDGIYQTPVSGLTDEKFEGAVWGLKIPKPFLELAEKVEAWITANGDSVQYKSESFAGYSYTRNDGALTWQGAFKSELGAWRKKR